MVAASVAERAYEAATRSALVALERNLIPDAVTRRLTRLLLAQRLRQGYLPSAPLQLQQLLQFVHSLEEMPIAIETDKAKAQHYELPTTFFKLVLGKNLKYSSCYFPGDSSTLEDAEVAMMDLYCERSKLQDGQSILDVGCGWGSLSLYIAKKYRNCSVTGICNSTTQKAFIEEQCRDNELSNIEIIVADISKFEMERSFDRIVSIEMFEDKNDDDWITRYFFTGGTMPSANLLLYFQEDVSVVDHWLVSGTHYARTSEEWLKRMDKSITSIRLIFEETYGKESTTKWIAYWRTFFISVAELFGYNNGDEWMVAHYLFRKK
uniref:S-adenosyl-L-methionine-dependent methyltransferase superfamily protein n=1 Tax=Zea mays TaxID=4577 RepID=A0A804UJ73_MAIZE